MNRDGAVILDIVNASTLIISFIGDVDKAGFLRDIPALLSALEAPAKDEADRC